MNLHKEDVLVSTSLAYAHNDVVLATRNGYGAHYKLDQIPASAPKSKGVKAMNLNDDTIIGVQTIMDANKYLLIVCESGAMKRLKLDEIDLMNRPVKGLLLHRQVKSNPNYLRYIKLVSSTDIVTFIGEETLKVEAKDISIMSREASFSNSIKLSDDYYMIKDMLVVPDIPLVESDNDKEYEELKLNV
jgi:topoisomerase-4 subunit A